MTSFNTKPVLIVECAISWAEIVVVLIIDSIILKITVSGTASASVHFFVDAVMCMLGICQKDELIIFLSLHLAAHGIWLIASLIMVVEIFMVQSSSTADVFFFFVISCVVSLLDLTSTIYFAIETSCRIGRLLGSQKVYAGCSQSLFFPLYFCKGVLLWIANLIIAIHVLSFQKQVRNGDIKATTLSRTQTIYTLPWDSYTDLLIPPSPPMTSPPEAPQPRSIMKNPNNPNQHARKASVKFRGPTSTESTNDLTLVTDLTSEVFRSAIRYPDVTEDYKYWDSYVTTSGRPH